MGYTSFFNHVVLLIAWLFVVISFFVIAIQLIVTLIEFKLTTLAGFALVPFGLFNKTAFLAEKVLGNVVASGVKVLVLAVIVGIGTALFSQFTVNYGTTQPTIEDTLSLLLADVPPPVARTAARPPASHWLLRSLATRSVICFIGIAAAAAPALATPARPAAVRPAPVWPEVAAPRL